MKRLLRILLFTFFLTSLLGCQKKESITTVGIVIPIEHQALQEIVSGFSDALRASYAKPIIIKVKNAQNDLNIQRAIIQQMRDDKVDIIVPIGTDVTQMTSAMVRNQPIVSLASDFSAAERQALPNCNMAVVHDKIPMPQLITFIHSAFPELKNITVIHSASDKVVPDIKELKMAANHLNITITSMMAATLPDLTNVTKSLPKNTDAILILKDNLIISGIAPIIKIASDHRIPLITSDQLSVEHGAGFALGLRERDIGATGAKLAQAILDGKSACNLPIEDIKNITVFINDRALQNIAIDKTPLIKSANKYGFTINITNALQG